MWIYFYISFPFCKFFLLSLLVSDWLHPLSLTVVALGVQYALSMLHLDGILGWTLVALEHM
jgi:hypothetical protein